MAEVFDYSGMASRAAERGKKVHVRCKGCNAPMHKDDKKCHVCGRKNRLTAKEKNRKVSTTKPEVVKVRRKGDEESTLTAKSIAVIATERAKNAVKTRRARGEKRCLTMSGKPARFKYSTGDHHGFTELPGYYESPRDARRAAKQREGTLIFHPSWSLVEIL